MLVPKVKVNSKFVPHVTVARQHHSRCSFTTFAKWTAIALILGGDHFDSAAGVCILHVCHTKAASAPPAEEESGTSGPDHGSASQDSAVPKTESLDSKEETELAQSESQEGGDSPPVVKQERTGAQSQTLTNLHSTVQPLSSPSYPPAWLHVCICVHHSRSQCLGWFMLTTPPCPLHLLHLHCPLTCVASQHISNVHLQDFDISHGKLRSLNGH